MKVGKKEIEVKTFSSNRELEIQNILFKTILKENNLRETYSTLLLKNNFNSKAISKLMGHATDIITIDVYGDNDEIIADCVDELDSFIESVCQENNELEIQLGINLTFLLMKTF